jgi:lysophospholipase L1-like esterase
MKTYLALGDSYTIGEQVLLKDSFPYQVVQMLRKNNFDITAPEIIAKTGWTTANLLKGISVTKLLQQYDFVSLLIGVNNQYDGIAFSIFEKEFEELILRSISLTNKSENVFVFSIPDWGASPFAADRDKEKITKEINEYNFVCKSIAEKYQCVYIEITEEYKFDADNDNFLAADRLHPSAFEYEKWAKKLVDNFTMDNSIMDN